MKIAAAVLTFTLLFAQLVQAKDGVSSFSLNMIQFSGEKDKSLTGSTGYAADFTVNNNQGAFRLQYGVDFQYAQARSYINDTGRNGTYYGSDFKIGLAIVPVPGGIISPFVEVAGLLGVKALNFDSNQTAVPRDNISASYGYRFGVGVNLGVFSSSSIKLAAYFVDNRATKLAAQSDYNLSSLTFSLGLNF